MRRLTYQEVKCYIKKCGYELISKEYEGSDKKLTTICPRGSIYEVTYSKFLQGRRCPCCRKNDKELIHKNKVDSTREYVHIKSYFTGDMLPNGKIAKTGFMMVKHLYCKTKYLIQTANFINVGQKCSKCCQKYENSFAYHIEVELGEPLEKYWDFEKNTVNPYHIYKNSGLKVWIKCQSEEVNELNGLKKKDYHPSYKVICSNFIQNNRCPYCDSKNIHTYDSFGYNNFDKIISWDSDNNISPFSVALNSHNKYKFICPKCFNKFKRSLVNSNKYGVECKECSMSEGEKLISTYLNYNNIKYEYEKEFNGLIGVGGKLLSYDFYLPEYNLLIEYQGEQHEKYISGIHVSYNNFKKQLEHDRRKKEYARNHNIEFLEIWYYDFNNIEKILKKQLNYNITRKTFND